MVTTDMLVEKGHGERGAAHSPSLKPKSSPGRRLILGKDKAECGMRTRGF